MGAEKRAVCCRRESRNVTHAEAAEEDESAKETENPEGAGGKEGQGRHTEPKGRQHLKRN